MTDVDIVIDEMFKALRNPCGSLKELAAKVGVSRNVVQHGVSVLREAPPDRYGWTIPHCKRGRTTPGRYIRILVDSKGTIFTDVKSESIGDGATGTVRHVKSLMENGAKTMRIAAAQFAEPSLRRRAKDMIRKMEFVAAEAQELDEVLTEFRPNGTDEV